MTKWVARVEGVIYDPEENQLSAFALGLGISTNNQAKAYALVQGMSNATKLGIKELIII
jgi:hypothetical protein